MDTIAGLPIEKALALIVGVIVAIGAVILPNILSEKQLSKFPFVGKELGNYKRREKAFLTDAIKLLDDGYKKYKSSIFRLTTTDGEHLIVPQRYLDELRMRPDDEISMLKALQLALEHHHTNFVEDNPLINHVVRSDLTTGLSRINPRLMEEVVRAIDSELPPCDDWTPVVIHKKLLRIVAIVSGNIFLGPELCRREEYLHASINYTVDIFEAVRALKKWRKSTRWLGAYLIPEIKKIDDHRARAKKFLVPIIKERRQMMADGEQMPDDMLQWMLNKADKFNVIDDGAMALHQLQLSMAAIHTTTMTSTYILFNIAPYPELIEEIRQEIRTVLGQHGGVFSPQALYHMKLLDSVMKESMRVNPGQEVRFGRVVTKPITLKDGTVLPLNSYVEAPYGSMTRDPQIYPDPDKFDPYRFYNLRKGGDEAINRHQFVTVTKESMLFGFGRHACPGRFFAANEIKLILANLLLKFDVKPKEPKAKEMVIGSIHVQDGTKEILLKKTMTE